MVTHVDLGIPEWSYLSRNRRFGHAVIVNTSPLCDIELDFLPENYDFFDLFKVKAESRFFITYPVKASPSVAWMYSANSEDVSHRVLLSHDQMRRFLSMECMLSDVTGHCLDYDGIIVRRADFGGKDFVDFVNIYKEVISYHRSRHMGLINTNKLFWYMDGDLIEWYENLKVAGTVEVMSLKLQPVQDSGDFASGLEYTSSLSYQEIQGYINSHTNAYSYELARNQPISLQILRSRSVAGLFCRILSGGALAGLTSVFLSDLNTTLFPFPASEKEEIGVIGYKILQQLLTTWKRI